MTAKRNRNSEAKKKAQPELEKRRESGEPGGGAGRRDEVRGSGVYPPFVDNIPEDAEVRTPGQWAQRTDGVEGGVSELNPLELGIEYDAEGRPISPSKRKRSEERGS